jgi:hypothetical protein
MSANHHDQCRRSGVGDVLGLRDPARAVSVTVSWNHDAADGCEGTL